MPVTVTAGAAGFQGVLLLATGGGTFVAVAPPFAVMDAVYCPTGTSAVQHTEPSVKQASFLFREGGA